MEGQGKLTDRTSQMEDAYYLEEKVHWTCETDEAMDSLTHETQGESLGIHLSRTSQSGTNGSFARDKDTWPHQRPLILLLVDIGITYRPSQRLLGK